MLETPLKVAISKEHSAIYRLSLLEDWRESVLSTLGHHQGATGLGNSSLSASDLVDAFA